MTDQPDPTFQNTEILEHANGRLMFPATLDKRNAKGQVVQTKVRVRIPNPSDLGVAHIRAVEWFAKQKALNRKDDAELFATVEQLEIIAISIRTYEPEHGQFLDREELAQWDDASIQAIQERINIFKLMVDPRESDITDDQIIETARRITRAGHPGPLGDMAGPAQLSYFMRTASLALNSPQGLCYMQSLGTSTPEP